MLKVPTPKNTANVTQNAAVGRAKYEPDKGGVIWNIKKFPGDFEALLRYLTNIYPNIRCEIELAVTTNPAPWIKPPISVEF